jgi:hypothetical protein
MTDIAEGSMETRTARIERHAGRAATLVRTVLTRSFATADQVTAWWTTLKAKVKSMKPAAKDVPAA